MTYQDIIYDKAGPVATITINRPEKMNAFTRETVDEMVDAFLDAWADRAIAAVILTGAGVRSLLSGVVN